MRVADGVYAFITPEERSSFQAGNSIAIVGDDGVLVFDTGNIPSMTRRQIAEIRRLTDKPVRFVVNSHWHPDHTLGNAEYRAAFPGVTVIGTSATRAGILERVPTYVDQMKSFAPIDSVMRLRLATGKMRDGSPMPDAVRLTWGLTTRDYAEFMPEVVHTTPSAPDSVFDDSLTIMLGKRRVQIVSPGRGNTAGDAFVFLPDERVLLTGDLVTVPCPFPGTAYFADWIRSLDALVARHAAVIVPGHGDVQHDDGYVRMVRELVAFTLDRARDAVKRGVPLDTLQKQIDFTPFVKRFAGDDPVRTAAFGNFYVQPAVPRAYEEAKFESPATKPASTSTEVSQSGSAASAPWPLDRPGLVFDTQRRLAVLFGGRDGPHANGTWEWDGSTWRERAIAGPSARHSHGMVFDSRRGRVVLFGGFDSTGFRNDTWEFDGTSWQKMSETGPAPRAAFGMAYDSARGRDRPLRRRARLRRSRLHRHVGVGRSHLDTRRDERTIGEHLPEDGVRCEPPTRRGVRRPRWRRRDVGMGRPRLVAREHVGAAAARSSRDDVRQSPATYRDLRRRQPVAERRLSARHHRRMAARPLGVGRQGVDTARGERPTVARRTTRAHVRCRARPPHPVRRRTSVGHVGVGRRRMDTGGFVG